MLITQKLIKQWICQNVRREADKNVLQIPNESVALSFGCRRAPHSNRPGL